MSRLGTNTIGADTGEIESAEFETTGTETDETEIDGAETGGSDSRVVVMGSGSERERVTSGSNPADAFGSTAFSTGLC
jgi:hypothetical protein